MSEEKKPYTYKSMLVTGLLTAIILFDLWILAGAP